MSVGGEIFLGVYVTSHIQITARVDGFYIILCLCHILWLSFQLDPCPHETKLKLQRKHVNLKT